MSDVAPIRSLQPPHVADFRGYPVSPQFLKHSRRLLTRAGDGPRHLKSLGIICLIAGQPLLAEKLVTVRSVVDRTYAEKRAAADPPAPETYVFAKGEYSAGTRRDPSLEKMSFLTLAQTVASDLKKQNYNPTKAFKTADLVIVLHWGVTMANDRGLAQSVVDTSALTNAFEAIGIAQRVLDGDATGAALAEGGLPSAVANYRAEVSALGTMTGGNNLLSASNAELLGFTSTLAKDNSLFVTSTEIEALRSMIDEERYFIILMAYDGAALRDGKKKRLWTTRMSIRSAGVNFTMALDRMSGAAALFHGKRQEGVALEVPQQRRGEVTIGEIKVLGEAEAAARPKARR